MSASTAVATKAEHKPPLVAGNGLAAIVPADVEQAFRMAQMVVRANMAPKGMEQPEKVVTAIMTGLEIGLKPMQALQSIAIVNGRPTLWGDASLGLVMASGLCGGFKESVEGSGEKMVAHCWAKRSDIPAESQQSFSVDDAKTAGLWGKQGPWKQYPRRMLQMRARSFALRDLFADVLKGLGVTEEVRDYRATAEMERQTSHEAELRNAIYRQAGQEPPEPKRIDAAGREVMEDVQGDEFVQHEDGTFGFPVDDAETLADPGAKVTHWSLASNRRAQKQVAEAIQAVNAEIADNDQSPTPLKLILQNNPWLEQAAPDRWASVRTVIEELERAE